MLDIYNQKAVYNALASEYEERAESLRPVIDLSISFLIKYLKNGEDILDIGCGVGMFIKSLSEHGFNVTGIEISPLMVEFAKRRNVNSLIIEADYLDYKFNKKFHGAVLSAFIHLFPKDIARQVISKLKKDLIKGGVAIIGTTESMVSREGWEAKSDYRNKRKRFRKHWTEKELEEFLIENNFEILELNKVKDLFNKTWMGFIVKNIE